MTIKKVLQPYLELPKAVYIMLLASVISNMGNFVHPLLTMFLTYKVGMGVATVGSIVAINSVAGLVGTLIGGKLIDKIGRKIIFMVFRTLSAVSILCCGFAKDTWIIVAFIMLSNFVTGISSPVYSTIMTDLTKGDKRKTAFSLHYMAMNVGMAVGPLMAAFLYNKYIRLLFIGDAVTTIISVILVATMVPETMPKFGEFDAEENEKDYHKETAEQGGLMKALLKRPQILIFSAIMVIYFLVFSQYNFGISLQLGDVFSKDTASLVFGTLMTVNTVLCSLLPPLLPYVIKNVKPSMCIALGGLFYTVGFGMMAFITSYGMFILSAVLWTIGEILVATNTNIYIADNAPISHRGRFNSIFPIIRKLGFILGPMLAGVYVKHFSIQALWIPIGILAFIGALLMCGLQIVVNKRETSCRKN
ncbi:Predicted arabinose efflux permease, MFS family [Hathewaya proteolytica DSM 3090]|uniref:Predicted arabinose efflux permease, MFS family n=1 Tax=Hathewaya proteolytica DSM 3090 TaxID=1121331 RepID=A0A1M6KKI2_9CLOT|nr:MFS transporter [Hathewaya proteolytica]SHJ59498.1 Predicted arabinose efflux permease, MFS family [Hathewaya proteolytica DSM 3090]